MPKRHRRLPLFLSALLISAAAPLGIIAVAQRATQPPEQKTRETQEAPLNESDARRLTDVVLTTIGKRFFDTEKLVQVNFNTLAAEAADDVAASKTPSEAAARLNALLAKLQTSHTQVFAPDEPEYYFVADVFSASSPDTWAAPNLMPGTGFFTAKFDGRDHVTGVLQGSPAHAAGILVGDEIIAVDGAPYHPIRSFRHRIGSNVAISIRRQHDAPAQTLTMRVLAMQPSAAFNAAMRESARVIEKNGKRIGYIQVWHMRGEKGDLERALSSIDGSRQGFRRSDGTYSHTVRPDGSRASLPPLDALIIDNRGKIGGTAGVAEAFLETIAGPRGGYFEATNREQSNRARPPSPRSFKGRSVMLIDHNTRSAGEVFAQGFKNENLGPVFGTRTAGAVTAGGIEQLPGGLLLYLAVARVTIDGKNLEGIGVSPDREITRPIPYSAGADPVLDAAIEHLARD